MRILAIESSCDETALAILQSNPDGSVSIRAEQIASQIATHRLYGGVVPEIASREHLQALPIVVDSVLQQAALELSDLDGIAVTQGPGLKGCLLMGFCYARSLAYGLQKPLYGVHHIEGHILACMLDNAALTPPFLSLVVSGGHTEIILVQQVGAYQEIARTTDDAAGEAFDKSAHLMGFSYPGGPALAKLADTVSTSRFELPRVMRSSPGFSFSGLKTAISLMIRKHEKELLDEQVRAELAHAIQSSIVDALCFKLQQAVQETGIRKIGITGGVAANTALRKKAREISKQVYFPSLDHCTDNAAMIGFAALARLAAGLPVAAAASVFARSPVEKGIPYA